MLLLLLTDTFTLQLTLQERSNVFYKQANPFAITTIKDWVHMISGADLDKQNHLEKTGHSQDRAQTTSFTPRHPWELNSIDLNIGEILGVGSQGRVFDGLYKGSPVAIKTLFVLNKIEPDAPGGANEVLVDTASEAEMLSRLRHANIIRFFGIVFLKEQKSIAMITELCQGGDLRAWIDCAGDLMSDEIRMF